MDCYLHKPKVHTRNTKPLAAVGFSRFDVTGDFSQFQEHLLCIYSTLVFEKLFFTVLQKQTAFLHGKVPAIDILLSEHKSGQTRQAANSLLLAREHSPDVNNKPMSIPYLEQGYCLNITIFNLKVES